MLIYGFHRLADIADRRAMDVDVATINTAIRESLGNYNEMVDSLMSLLVQKTTEYKTKYRGSTGGRLQPLDENGRARPRKAIREYEVALPIFNAGDAWGANFLTNAKMTVQDVNDTLDQMQMRDLQWLVDQIIAAIFAEANYTFPDDEHGDLTVKPLANGDADLYLPAGGVALATANHLMAQAAAIGDGADNPFPTIRAKLRGFRDTAGQIVALSSTSLRTSIEGLATFRERNDPNLSVAADTQSLVANLAAMLPPNAELFGYADGVFQAEWPNIPSGFGFATSTGGERPIAMREDTVASLRGFQEIGTREDTPWMEHQYLRRAGFGGWNRVGAVAFKIGAADYDPPTGYAPPLP